MFESLKRAHQFAMISALWARVTSVDLRDRGQISRVASRKMVEEGFTPAQAWLSTLVAWVGGMPWPDEQRRLAECITRFALDPRAQHAVAAGVLEDTRLAASAILDRLHA